MFRRIAISLISLGAAAVSPSASANHEGAPEARGSYAYAPVVNVEPIVRYVRVETPIRECWDEEEYYEPRHRGRGAAGATIAGGIIGGVIGHQFGSGKGNDAMTVLGTLVGSAIANDRARRRQASGPHETYSRTVERCNVRYETHEEERIDGYWVTYEYNGQTYTTRMGRDPGKEIKVRVSVSPAGY